jgi:lipase chaperone LimK
MKWPPRRLALVALVIGVLCAAVGRTFVLRVRGKGQSPEHVPTPAQMAAVATTLRPRVRALEAGRPSAAAVRPAPAPVGTTDPLPASLEGTEVDGWLGVDDEGHLVVTPGARWFFDYFLSAAGEEPPEQIRARIVAGIKRRLPAAGAQEAIDLLDRYLAYRDRVRALQASGVSEDLGQRLAQLHDIRRETFGDANATALFGEEEQMQAVDIERRQVLSDQSLPPEEREHKLAALEQQLPPAARQARAEAMALIHLQTDEQQLRQAGGSPEDVHALREQRFGAEAAERLDALDHERAAWRQRLDDYHNARDAVESNSALTPDARARAVEALLAQRFTSEERLRVEALDTLRAASQ